MSDLTQNTSGDGGGETVTILYTNWRGETAVRRIVPGHEDHARKPFWIGSTAWHQERQWLVTALDVEKGERRDFALAGIKAWGQEAVAAALAAPAAKGGTEPTRRERALDEALREAVAMLEVDKEADEPGSDLYTWLRTTAPMALGLCEFPLPPAGAAGGATLTGFAPYTPITVRSGTVAGDAGGGSGDLGPECEKWCGRPVCEDRGCDGKPVPTPDLGAQGEPVAWAFEWLDDRDSWCRGFSEYLPDPAGHNDLRHIRPLYAAPAAPRSGSGVTVEHAQEAFFYFLCRKYVQRADARQKSMGLQYTEAETHDLAKEMARFASALFAPSQPHAAAQAGDGGGR